MNKLFFLKYIKTCTSVNFIQLQIADFLTLINLKTENDDVFNTSGLGRLFDLRSWGCKLETHRRHCVLPSNKTRYPQLSRHG